MGLTAGCVWLFITIKLQCKIHCISEAPKGHLLTLLTASQHGGLGSSASLWMAVILVAHPFAASTVTSGEPNRETTCEDLALQGGTKGRTVVGGVRLLQFGGTGVNAGDWTCPLSSAGAAMAPGPMGLQPCLCFLTSYERTSRITKDYS